MWYNIGGQTDGKADDVVTTKITTPTKPIVTTKVTTNTKSTTPTKTTTKVTTTTPVTTTTKTEPEITDSNLYGYWYDISDRLDDPILDWTRITFQIGSFIDEGIAYSDLYNIGKTFGGTDYEKAVAVCQYAYDLGGHSCIEYALNAYFLAKGAGIECYIARSAKYDWYGHVANIIKLDEEYYYMEPQGNIVGSPHTYAAGGNGISYPDGLDVVTDIYDSRVYVTLSDDVSSAVESTWNDAKSQIKSIVDNVVFPVLDVVLVILLFVKIGTLYMEYRKHGQFEWTPVAIIFGCLLFTLTAPLYIWNVVGI